MKSVKKAALLCLTMIVCGALGVQAVFFTFNLMAAQADFKKDGFVIDSLVAVAPQDSVSPLAISQPVTINTGTNSETISASKRVFPVQDDSAEKAAYIASKSYDYTKNGNFIYYSQVWSAYRNHPYGSETIGTYGCGPTNIAMCVSTLKHKLITPIEVTELAERWGCFVKGQGSSHTIFEKAEVHYRINVEEFTATKKNIVSRLKNGELLICSMTGDFSQGGHFVTLRGITASGKILIADSYVESNTNKEWSLDYLYSQLKYKTMWSFTDD